MFKRDNKWMNMDQLRKYEGKVEEVGEPPVGTGQAPVVEEETIEDAKPVYVCPICGRETKSQWHLDKHITSHKDEPMSEVVAEPSEIDNK